MAEATSQAGPRVKGVAFRTIDACFLELAGPERLEQARAAMPQEVADGYRYGTLLASSWYSIAWYKSVLAAFRQATAKGPELPRDIGRAAAQRDMRGVHKQIFARLVAPQTLLGMSQRVFNTYYDTGTFHIDESRRGFVLARCHGCVGWDENMWSELAGSCESLLEIAGAKEVKVRRREGGGDGDAACVLEATWV